MKVYHGSFTEIKEVDLSQCAPFKDFGIGFYVTKFENQAKVWAIRKGRKNDNDGFVTEFNFNDYAFDSKHIKSLRLEGYNEKWFDFVILNRKSKIQSHDFDIVEGPVADDKIQSRIDDYLNGIISKQQFLNDLTYRHEETHQICFCSVRSLLFLEKKGNTKEVSKFLHIGEPITEKLVKVFGFNEETAIEKFYSSEVFTRLADTSTKMYNKDWTEIYLLLLEELNLKQI